VWSVGSDDHAGQVQRGKQQGESGYLLGRAADLLLGQHRAGGVVHPRQQVRRATVAGGVAGAAQGLAVDRYRRLPWPLPLVGGGTVVAVTLGQPGGDRGGQGVGVKPAERAADGGLGGDRSAPGKRIAAGAERGADRLGRIGGPLGDGGKRPRPSQHRGRRQGQDGDQWVVAPGAGAWVANGGQVGEQVRGLGFLQRVGIAQRGQPRRDRPGG
jgi:hypothetical protein